MRADVTLLSSLTLSKAKDNGAGSLENQNGNFPGAAGLQQSRRRLRHCPATTSRTTARPASSGRCRSAAASGGAATRSTALDAARRRLADRRHQHRHAGRDGDVHLRAGARRFRCRASRNDFSRREQLPAERDLRSLRAGDQQSITNWFNPACVALPTDPSQPFGNARAQQRARPELLAGRSRGHQVGRRSAAERGCSCGSRRSTCSTA